MILPPEPEDPELMPRKARKHPCSGWPLDVIYSQTDAWVKPGKKYSERYPVNNFAR